MDHAALWQRYRACLCDGPEFGFSLDYSRMNFPDDFFLRHQPMVDRALAAMEQLEDGALANPDEDRQVGHYWLRDAKRCPEPAWRRAITQTVERIGKFAQAVHAGKIRPPEAAAFKNLLVIGIGGSALGPQFLSRALGTPRDRMRAFFFDNTDPDGMDLTLEQIEASGGGLAETLCIVISKSGGTKETRNGMLEAQAAFVRGGLKFERHAVAITRRGSALNDRAVKEGWLARFPMWDWVGGRTSVTSAVGLLPAALQGLDTAGLLRGARQMDELTREENARANPAVLMALMWHHAGQGRGAKDMVVLPYKDRLELFSRYLQQLVMESLGKELDLAGRIVHQGLSVYGNKGSTDQHAYVQQLRDGLNNFFVTFIEVLEDRAGPSPEVEEGVTSGDYLSGFLQGTRSALFENGRESLTLTLPRVDAENVGRLIALYERTVGLYALMIAVNAYHQPGVEAGKKAAEAVLKFQGLVVAHLRAHAGQGFTAEEAAEAIGAPAEAETVHLILRHLAANPGRKIKAERGATVFETKYSL